MKTWDSWCIDPYFLDLGISWRWVVSFTPWPLYPQGKSPSYLLGRKLGGPQNWSGWCGEEKFMTLPGLQPWPLSHSAHRQSLYWLRYPGSLEVDIAWRIPRDCSQNMKLITNSWKTIRKFLRLHHTTRWKTGCSYCKIFLFISVQPTWRTCFSATSKLCFPSQLQPLYLGIIHATKCHYRKQLIRKTVGMIDSWLHHEAAQMEIDNTCYNQELLGEV
jgi:hypothetical protein